ncbi:MAG: histidine--tRNA ligase [Candidatus Levybacteria bacterium]|nr:histidine--tRNA ligase [Candidatus Levybacteria bacterium]
MDKIQTLKGFRDFLPAEAKKRQYVINTLESVFESYGFDPLETPALEYEEVLIGKYGEEGDKLMYRFADNGGRRVALRYDQTVPLARVVAQYANVLPFPFKRYQIQPVWRAENTQKGRFREFLQCDVDTVGTDSLAADAEIVAVVAKSYEALGFTDYKIIINDRKVFKDIPLKAIIIIDKLKKIGEEKVKQELKEKGFDPEMLGWIQSAEQPDTIKMIVDIAEGMGVNRNKIVFEPTLARGLDYYTGMIFEVEIGGYTVGSVGGGGRYDNLIGMFARSAGHSTLRDGSSGLRLNSDPERTRTGSDSKSSGQAGRDIPAVGFAFGFDRIMDAMGEKDMLKDKGSSAKVLVTIFGLEFADDSMEVSSQLRAKNITTELWLDANVKMEKQLKYANEKGIPYVIIIGPEEKEKGVVTVRDMKTREQKQVPLGNLPDALK